MSRQYDNRGRDQFNIENLKGNLQIGDYRRAIDFYQQSLEIQSQIGNVRGGAISCFNLGLVLVKLRLKQEAIESYQQA